MTLQTDQKTDVIDQPVRLTPVSTQPRRRSRVVVLGGGVLILSAAIIGAVFTVQSSTSTDDPRPSAAPQAESAQLVVTGAERPALPPPVRDQWYLDEQRPAAPAAVQAAVPPVRDQWYLDSATSFTQRVLPSPSSPPVRDQWYLEN
jgi:hypothetical protein